MNKEKDKEKKFASISALASFTIPVVLMIVFYLVGFGPPESDSAVGQGSVLTLISFPIVYIFQVVAYWVLGKVQHKRSKPSLILGSIVGAVLAIPLSAVVLNIAIITGAKYWEAILGALLYMFIPLWLSFTTGAATQYYLMVRRA